MQALAARVGPACCWRHIALLTKTTHPPPSPLPAPPCRAVEPGRHYLEFWTTSKDDIFQLVPSLNEQYAANASAFHDMAARAQEFASMHLSPRARFLYWRAAILAYRQLVPDMDEYVAHLVRQLKEQGKL